MTRQAASAWLRQRAGTLRQLDRVARQILGELGERAFGERRRIGGPGGRRSRSLEAERAVAPGLIEEASALMEGERKVDGEKVGFLAPTLEEHGGFVRTGHSGKVLETMTAEAAADLPEDPTVRPAITMRCKRRLVWGRHLAQIAMEAGPTAEETPAAFQAAGD